MNPEQVLIDVRTPQEYAAGHAEGAINLPLGELESGRMPDIPKDMKVGLYCRSGNRSEQAKALLKQAGYGNVDNLGGLDDVASGESKVVT